MPGIYLCDVVGTGGSRDPLRASITLDPSSRMFVLMIDDGPRKKAVVWADDVAATGAGVALVQSAPTKEELIAKLQATTMATPQRNQINSWLNASGYSTIPAGTTNQYDVVMFVCRQVNPAVDLSVLTA